MFNLEQFIDDCRQAVKNDDAKRAVAEIVERAISVPGEVLQAVGEPTRAGVTRLYQADDLTVLNLVWGPHMTLMPHNHEMWAAIGIYTGREDNIFWRRVPDSKDGAIDAAGAHALSTGESVSLGRDLIHSVTNPVDRLTGAIHVYGGDFFETPRSEWDPETLHEGRYDVEKNLALFEKSNERLVSSNG